ncbi:MAG: DNA-binding transcriptional regulator [Pirellulaceae bacterium]|nr:DNA-binding transcriptional regulator [Pirellulaceae bacterium]
MDDEHYKVALLVQTASDWSRQVLRGVADYVHEQGNWEFFIEPRGFYEQLQLPTDWHGDGVILRLTYAALAKSIRRRKLPAVNVSWLGKHSPSIPKVISDEVACGNLAAEHFLERGFRCFGYVGPIRELGYADQLGKVFVSVVRETGYSCSITNPLAARTESQRHRRRERLLRWIRSLQTPIAVLVWNTAIGREITDICGEVGLKVPDDVAIICAEYDPLIASLASIPLSNLDQAPTRVGYEAAALLDRLMQGESAPKQPILIPPIGVVQRQSSDTAAVDDALVAEAMSFIRDNFQQPIQVVDLEKQFDVSRRMLEHRFSKSLGYTPAAEIRRNRLEYCKRMLVETDWTIAAIASQSGFNHPEVMIRAFQRELGMSPSQYRHSR